MTAILRIHTRCLLRLISIIVLFSIVFCPRPVFAGPGGPGIFEMDLPITDDLTIDPNAVRTFAGDDFNLHVRSVLPYYTALKFNIRGLPASSRITYAELKLYMMANYDAQEDEWLTIPVRPANFSWTENSYRGTGGNTFILSYPVAESVVTDPEVDRPITWDVTDFAKAWADNEPNNGIILYPTYGSERVGENTADFRFESKEHAEVWGGHRPTLTVYYRSNNWFNFELFQIIASIFNRPTPVPSPYYMQLPQISPTPSPSSLDSKSQFADLLSPTPTLTIYEEKLYLPASTPTSLPQLYYQPQQYEAVLPTSTPTPKVFVKPTPTPTPKIMVKPTATPTSTVLWKTNPSPTPTGAKKVKGVYSGELPEEVLPRFVGAIFQVGCNQSLACSILYHLLNRLL